MASLDQRKKLYESGFNDYAEAHKLVDSRIKQYSKDMKSTGDRLSSRDKLISSYKQQIDSAKA